MKLSVSDGWLDLRPENPKEAMQLGELKGELLTCGYWAWQLDTAKESFLRVRLVSPPDLRKTEQP